MLNKKIHLKNIIFVHHIKNKTMEILSHRGLWYKKQEGNTLSALKKSMDNNFGIETDIRDFNKELVISHDMPDKDSIKLTDFFSLYCQFNEPFPLALNIKADGLQKKLEFLLKEYNIRNYFFFDMSIPDTLNYLKKGLNVFMRQSEYEKERIFYKDIIGVWLDSFENIWFTKELILEHLNNGKKVCIVSEELHNRPYLELWELIKKWELHKNNQILLCTDFPEKAIKFFKK